MSTSNEVSLRIAATSLEYVRIRVKADAGGSTDYNPTADTVQMAFTLHDADPLTADFKTASWFTKQITTPTSTVSTYYASCLVGPGGATQLSAGRYSCFVKVTDSPEIPIKRAPGLLEVY